MDTSRPTPLRFTKAHRPGTCPAVVADSTTALVWQRLANKLWQLESDHPGSLPRVEAVIDALLGT